MDDFISGLHNNKDIQLEKPKVINRQKKAMDHDSFIHSYKKTNLYLIMDAHGKVLIHNKRMYGVLQDTAFLNKLNGLAPNNNLKILN